MVDYSKWNKAVEISDDEDDTHPNIDTASLNRWRHDARLTRMEESRQEWAEFDASKADLKRRQKDLNRRKVKGDDVTESSKNLASLELSLKERELELQKKDRLTPWNVDTIATDGFSKTVINRKEKNEEKIMTEDEKAEVFLEFTKANDKLVQRFGMLRRYEDSKKFLLDHPHLACEDTANYLVYWCIDLAIEQKFGLMEHVSHQCIAIQFLLQLGKQLEIDPRACISPFFSKIAHIEQTEYKDAFTIELLEFQKRIRRRAEEKIEKAMKEERDQRLGPGGLDPIEVMESLPEALKICFEKRDIPMLQKAISEMPPEDASRCIQQCIDSGLWVPPSPEKSEEQVSKEKNDSFPPINSMSKSQSPLSTPESSSNAIATAVWTTYDVISTTCTQLWNNLFTFLQRIFFGRQTLPQEPHLD